MKDLVTMINARYLLCSRRVHDLYPSLKPSSIWMDMPARKLSPEKVEEVKRLRSLGQTYRGISRMTGVLMGKISEICAKDRHKTFFQRLVRLEHYVHTLRSSMEFLLKRTRLLADLHQTSPEEHDRWIDRNRIYGYSQFLEVLE